MVDCSNDALPHKLTIMHFDDQSNVAESELSELPLTSCASKEKPKCCHWFCRRPMVGAIAAIGCAALLVIVTITTYGGQRKVTTPRAYSQSGWHEFIFNSSNVTMIFSVKQTGFPNFTGTSIFPVKVTAAAVKFRIPMRTTSIHLNELVLIDPIHGVKDDVPFHYDEVTSEISINHYIPAGEFYLVMRYSSTINDVNHLHGEVNTQIMTFMFTFGRGQQNVFVVPYPLKREDVLTNLTIAVIVEEQTMVGYVPQHISKYTRLPMSRRNGGSNTYHRFEIAGPFTLTNFKIFIFFRDGGTNHKFLLSHDNLVMALDVYCSTLCKDAFLREIYKIATVTLQSLIPLFISDNAVKDQIQLELFVAESNLSFPLDVAGKIVFDEYIFLNRNIDNLKQLPCMILNQFLRARNTTDYVRQESVIIHPGRSPKQRHG